MVKKNDTVYTLYTVYYNKLELCSYYKYITVRPLLSAPRLSAVFEAKIWYARLI